MDLRDLARVEGPSLVLRLIQPDDAAYVHALRSDPGYNRYLSPVNGTVDDQRNWIGAYKEREAEGRELYYVIARRDGVPCGLIRLYDIGPVSFTWGSWILDHNKPPEAALESAILSFGVGFERLQRQRALVDVRAANERALAFYLRFRMSEIRRTAQDIFFEYPRERYRADWGDHPASFGPASKVAGPQEQGARA